MTNSAVGVAKQNTARSRAKAFVRLPAAMGMLAAAVVFAAGFLALPRKPLRRHPGDVELTYHWSTKL